MEGESPLLKEGLSPSKPPSLPRTFPKSTRPYIAKICFAMFGRVLLGKVFLFLGRYFFAECGFAPALCVGRIWRIYFAWISYPTALSPPIGRDSRTLQKFPPPAQAKTSPQDPHPQKGETKLRSSHGGGLVGKLGVGQGGLEGRATPTKGVALRLQGLPPLPPPRQPQNETVEEVEERGENESNHQNRGNRADAEQKSHR